MNSELRDRLIELFGETATAHHAAFAAVDGADPDWPVWYARHLQTPLGEALQTSFTVSQLVYCLMTADQEHSTRAAEQDWQAFYAAHFLERFEPDWSTDSDRLILYYSRSCPFCTRVLDAIKRLGTEVEMREVFSEPRFRQQLVAARGRATVPVLRIIAADGDERWLPESLDIIRYLDNISR